MVAVYGAGFMRTAAAAERFAQQSNERVLSPAEAEVIASMVQDTARALAVSAGAATGNVVQQSPPAAAPATKVDATTAKVSSSATADSKVATANNSKSAGATTVASSEARRDSAAQQSERASAAPAPGASVASAASVPANAQPTGSVPAQTPPVAAPSSPPVVSSVQPTSSSTPASTSSSTAVPVAPPATKVDETATPPAESKPALKWKDGNYTGYGTSRHGDIEVYLETDAGKISYIKISQCLTQYSCSWISHLPAQVIARQGPNVDGVSGATQSVNAFYYAVVQALAKAK